MTTAMTEEDQTLALLELALAGRPERVVDMVLGVQPPQVTAAYGGIVESLAALGRAEDAASPGPALRGRLMQSLTARKATATRRAVLVIDMLNDHLTPGRPLEVPRAREVVPALSARLDEARKDGTPVVYVVDQHDPNDPDLEIWPAHNIRDTLGDEIWPALAPKPGDRVVTKPTYSAFTSSTLEAVLDELKVDTLVMTGCLTEIGMLATATRALELGFAVEMPPDSQAGSSEEAEKAAMSILRLMPPYGLTRKARLERLAVAA
jgi:nicotinamidase-related amidase